jgi:hypothetical protein
MFTFGHVDIDILIWDILFPADESDKTRACGKRVTV